MYISRSITGPILEECYECRGGGVGFSWYFGLVSITGASDVVGCRWVFTVKHRLNGSIERYKALLVAKGYTQTYVVDYFEIFSPVVSLNSIRVLFSVAMRRCLWSNL